VSPWGTWLAYVWPTLLLTIIGLFLRRASRDPKTPCGDAVLIDLCLGLVAVVASVLWLRVFVSVVF
jgi:apolipoprotein N-acyltransferase